MQQTARSATVWPAARAVDSDVWYAEVIRRRRERLQQDPSTGRPNVPLLEEDVNYWLREFGGQSELDRLWSERPQEPAPSVRPPDHG